MPRAMRVCANDQLAMRKSVKEIADIVGVAEATVKTRMFYARKKLAELVSAS
jgi:DNA-directed RNA polymerase specialized sigma24 family protein